MLPYVQFVQGGDFVKGTGAFGESIYGAPFKDEPKGLKLPLDSAGLVAMANGGKNSNTSQWFITLCALPDLSGKHVVFGRVVQGMEVVQALAEYHALHADGEGWKVPPPFVWACGVE